ncbi:MAM domain-containing glycosylphosphatidylinositol anchor protein 2-like isoform X2 [Mytilus californianus]|uniref:MAM domain-containing glycosylphosphatidylinositol anchor protein 2-like isoform X2 n=1 Tax=Mytilus californianus TaxID=6549 RepID=UPI002246ED5A|nr:MAM domain-containing glycosylphosphatidylinositol anchor protein 2-like isoform X2 [Mytilus californianus]
MDKSSTKTTVSSSTNRKLKIAACLFLSTTVIFVSLFIWSEYKVTPCPRVPCEHGGNCSVTGNSFSCTCSNGFTGLQCQIYHANFENNMGSIFFQNLNDDFDWTLNSGKTSTSRTGPSSAYEGDYYLYTESSNKHEGDVARLLSRDFIFDNPGCLKFHHHMDGSGMGTLNVYQGSSLIWNITGDQGDEWHLAEISLQANSSSSSKITFEAVLGSNFLSDLAIDDVQVLLTGC